VSDAQTLNRQARTSLERLLPRLQARFATEIEADPHAWQTFKRRLNRHFSRLFCLLHQLYAGQYDFFYHLEELLYSLAQSWFERPADLKRLDAQREAAPDWLLSNRMLGGVCYVDLFAGDLEAVRARIPYFKELGLTYLHLMPLFCSPEGENDGGYAVSSYREVNPRLGTMAQLSQLAAELRQEGISLVLDLVFNHTSDEHLWATQAKAGDETYLEYYRTFPDRSLPDAYEKNLRDIFPDEHPGQFTYWPEMQRWVWTTFHRYQWDLNYANPEVFTRMATEMLFLANIGVEVVRLDAVAFIWKEMGTNCENLPQAHRLIQAFNAVARLAAPALVFKSEAIVHPDDVVRYISQDECQVSYNPLLMALLWNSLATRETRMLRQALVERFKLPPGCTWVNYVRCHDDIGWTFSDEDARRLKIDGYAHRRFLNDFYTGRFEGSFSRGLPFQENPKTGDVRISGMCASLAGLEEALREETEVEVDLAIRRILLIHAIILTVGGIPLLYLGDELGTINDYNFRNDPAKASDSRWVHRPFTDWERSSRRHDPGTVEGRVYGGLRCWIELRRAHAVFGDSPTQVIETGNNHVLGYARLGESERVLVLANFSEEAQSIPANLLRLYGLSYNFIDLLTDQHVSLNDIHLEPYGILCLQA
jgi:amylosucrase